MRILFCLLIVFHLLAAKGMELSDSARISLLTVSPGTELYSTFGHSGIRVTDFKQNFDVVFNYGTFDFNQPDFYVNFVRGRLLYMLDVESFRNFMMMYEYEQRSVVEDELYLTTAEKQNIFAFLHNNAQPENRDYPYDFFFDNCATRIRDVFEKELNEKLTFDYSKFRTDLTLRQMLDLYVDNMPWVKFGFYLILGLPCDIKAEPRVQAFLPDYLRKAIKNATINKEGGEIVPFVTSSKSLLEYPKPYVEDMIFIPKMVTLLLLVLVGMITLLEYSVRKNFLWFDVLLFSFVGLLGCLFLFMWFGTDHYSVPRNLNMLWAIPLHLPFALLMIFKSMRKWVVYWFRLVFPLMVALLFFKIFLPQPLHMALSSVIIILALRSWRLGYYLKKIS